MSPDGEVIGAEELRYGIVVTALDQSFLALLPQDAVRVGRDALFGRIVEFVRARDVLVRRRERDGRFFELLQQSIL